MWRALLGGLVIAVVAMESPTASSSEPRLTEDTAFYTDASANPGGLKMYAYVPEGVRTAGDERPLVVLLHGCGQTADAYFGATAWPQLAEQWQFAILAPEQQPGFGSYPGSLIDFALMGLGLEQRRGNVFRCFKWFEAASRTSPEAESIVNMIDRMLIAYPGKLDRERIYVTGLSGGAAMTVAMLALYPDVFAGGAPIAGIPFNCAEYSGRQGIVDCMSPSTNTPARVSPEEGGKGYAPERWGRWVRNIMCPWGKRDSHAECPGPWPMISIWQGAQDPLVAPGNQRDIMRQWTNVHGIDQVPDRREELTGSEFHPYAILHEVYENDEGVALVETWRIGGTGPGTGHATPVDPDSEQFPCGTEADYIQDANICSSLHIGRFWGLDRPGAEM